MLTINVICFIIHLVCFISFAFNKKAERPARVFFMCWSGFWGICCLLIVLSELGYIQ